MIVAHNLSALNTQRQFGLNMNTKKKSVEKLSSGYRINRSADDAAGLAISEKMRRQIRGLNQATENAQEGISLVQVADGAMNEITEMLQRCNELAVKAANGTWTNEDRSYIQMEVAEIATEIERVTKNTTYNEIPILDGGGPDTIILDVFPQGNSLPRWVSIDSKSKSEGIMADEYVVGGVTYTAARVNFSSFNSRPGSIDDLTGTGFHYTSCSDTRYYSIRFDANTIEHKVSKAGNNGYVYTVGVQGATSAKEILEAMQNALGTENAGSRHMAMVIENDNTAVFYDKREDVQPDIQAGYGIFETETVVSTKQVLENDKKNLKVGTEVGQSLEIELPDLSFLNTGYLDVSTVQSAGQTISIIQEDLQYISDERSKMGAYQNRLEHTVQNLSNIAENTQAAESAIRDTDMAKEIVANSNNNILEQVGLSIQAQVNKSHQGVLRLLR